MESNFSFIIPVYNRPEEMQELLQSFTLLNGAIPFEVIVVEDGSVETSETVIAEYKEQLNLRYFVTKNQGAGKSRNFGMRKASGDYFIILDSDCIIPENYLWEVRQSLESNYTDAYGGPDAAHESFTLTQKAINYSMTSFLTTGGIRGKKKAVGKFQPRSFNFGISKKAFEETGGFSDLKIGEDIDLTFRLWELGFETKLISEAFVYHKRRTTLGAFYKQTNAFGNARPYLNKTYPGTAKLAYWFPSLFVIGIVLALFLLIFNCSSLLVFYSIYFLLLFIHATVLNKNIFVGALAIITTLVQFFGYGTGFIKGMLK